jgi:hypothetical protein
MRMETGRAEVLHLCHLQPYKQVRRRPLRGCRRRLTALIGEQAASRGFNRDRNSSSECGRRGPSILRSAFLITRKSRGSRESGNPLK